MLDFLMAASDGALLASVGDYFSSAKNLFLVFAGFSLIIFVHELGHFLAAKWCDVRVERFAVGFGKELFGFTRGETRYSFNALPLGGYVKMLGQDDFEVDKSGEWRVKDDPRSFSHKTVGQRMIVVSAGVVANLIFAALIFMLVFMIGRRTNPPIVGNVGPNSTAEQAGIQIGDRITRINDKDVYDFQDIRMSSLLAKPDEPLTVEVQRNAPDGETETLELDVVPEKHPNTDAYYISVDPMLTLTVQLQLLASQYPEAERLLPGDRILKVDGREVDSWVELTQWVKESRTEGVTLTVERPSEKPEGDPRIVEVPRRPFLHIVSQSDEPGKDGDLLGFIGLREISQVSEGMPADKAGMKAGDVILQVGSQAYPTLDEVLDVITNSSGTAIDFTVLRPSWKDGQRVYEEKDLSVTPTEGGVMGLRKHKKPLVGINIFGKQMTDRLIIANVLSENEDGTPTAASVLKEKMPRGSVVTHVNDEPVKTWGELAVRLIESAGSEVKITWQYEDGPAQSEVMHVPHTLGTTFDLKPGHYIKRIGDHRSIDLEIDGLTREYNANNWRGAREILRKYVGETVEVEVASLLGEQYVVELEVTEEMLDTWRLRVEFEDIIATQPLTEVMREPNPFKALMIGVNRTYSFILQVYTTLQRMIVTRSVGIEQVSGPVGIFQVGAQVADQSIIDLLFLLGFISANLAVINFLPLPIVDGGLFVFLLIEKIKGSPLSLKVQMATQMIGLALIISIFVMVTFNDILRLFS